jgi:hypothetical protein
VTYYNDGDWVESCTALVEDHQGAIAIVDWAAETREAEMKHGKHSAPSTAREEEPA